jgi:hypothetical protein
MRADPDLYETTATTADPHPSPAATLRDTHNDEQASALYGLGLSTYVFSVQLNSRQWLGREEGR